LSVDAEKSAAAKAELKFRTEGEQPVQSVVPGMAKFTPDTTTAQGFKAKTWGEAVASFVPGYKEMTAGAKDIIELLKSYYWPADISPEHAKAAMNFGAHIGELKHNREAAKYMLQEANNAFTKMGVTDPKLPPEENPGWKWASDVSQGRKQPTPELQKYADTYKALTDEAVRMVQALGPGNLDNVRESYFPGRHTVESRRAFNQALKETTSKGTGIQTFDDPKTGLKTGDMIDLNDWTTKDKAIVRARVRQLIDAGEGSDENALGLFTRRPLEGKGTFRKPKVFEDTMTAMQFGLEPISPHPIDVAKSALDEVYQYVAGKKGMNQQEALGNVKYFKLGAEIPDGWAKVNDKLGDVYYRNENGELVLSGHRYAKQAFADIVNNKPSRSEERRVGKECRSRWSPYH